MRVLQKQIIQKQPKHTLHHTRPTITMSLIISKNSTRVCDAREMTKKNPTSKWDLLYEIIPTTPAVTDCTCLSVWLINPIVLSAVKKSRILSGYTLGIVVPFARDFSTQLSFCHLNQVFHFSTCSIVYGSWGSPNISILWKKSHRFIGSFILSHCIFSVICILRAFFSLSARTSSAIFDVDSWLLVIVR